MHIKIHSVWHLLRIQKAFIVGWEKVLAILTAGSGVHQGGLVQGSQPCGERWAASGSAGEWPGSQGVLSLACDLGRSLVEK